MVCRKNGEGQVNIRDMHAEKLKQVKGFEYLRSLINNKGGCKKEVRAKVSASWMKRGDVKTVLNDERMPIEIKSKDIHYNDQAGDDV